MHSFFFIFDKTDVLNRFIFLLLVFCLFESCDNKKSTDYNSPILESDYSKLPDNKKISYLDSIEKKIDLINIDSIKIKKLFEVAAEYYYLNKDNTSFKTSKKIFEIAKKNKDSVNMGRALYYMGDCYEDLKKDSAYYYYKESEKIFRLIKNDEKLAKALFNKAHLLFSEGNYIESEIEVIKALQHLSNSKKNYELLYSCYYLQASNHTELDEYDKALNYLNLANESLVNNKENYNKDIFLEYKSLVTIAKCNIYDKKGAYKKSIFELNEVLNKIGIKKNPTIYSTILGNIAFAEMKLGNYKNAETNYKLSISIEKNKKNNKGYLYKIINFGELKLLQKDSITATEIFKDALPLSKSLKSGREILKILNFLSFSDKTNSSNYKTEYIRINDSIIKKQRENREKFARIEYETDKVEEENKTLSDKNLLLLLGLTASITIFLIILIIRDLISRRKELYLIQQKEIADEELFNLTKEFQTSLVKAKEAEQKKLSKELHDGIVNKIYGIRMMLGSLNANSDETSKSQRLVYIKDLHVLESEVRNLSHDLNTDFSKYVGEFNFLLEQLVQNNTAIGKTHFISEISSAIDWNMYSSVVKINIYRVLQELLQNVSKYAQAQNCYVTIFEHENYLIVEVKDDGVGFNVNATSKGIGIKNIKERIKSIGSKIEIKSNENEGTHIRFKIKIGSL